MTTAPRTTIREHFIRARAAFQAIEPVMVDGFAMVSPWLSAVFPAALTGWNVAHYLTNEWGALQYPVAIVAALAVESLGISATHSAIKEWAKGKNTNAGYFRLAMASGFQYLAAVIVANVLLEAAYVGDWPRIVAKAILATLTIPGALVIAIRAQSSEDAIERAQEKADKRAEKAAKRPALSPAPVTILNAPGENNTAKTSDNSQAAGDNSRHERGAWVADYMTKNSVSQATAYRHYAKLYPPK